MNRLINEKSPYLLQHAHNPIHWYPWGEDAFNEALKRDVPIFLSVGYSTCHWCHVMERESFIDNDVADILNSYFVSIKVDREERPDVDKLYMDFCHLMTGRGGWPLTILMTPQKRPFYADTYLPRHSNERMIGLVDLLTRTVDLWEKNRDEITNISNTIFEHIQRIYGRKKGKSKDIDYQRLCGDALNTLKSAYDSKNGGFGLMPKFPMPVYLLFLIQLYRSNHDKDILAMIKNSLTAMRLGGIYDHVGGGFHRYCVDERWHVPHFEKMLYDQALLIQTYTEAFSITNDDLFKDTAIDVIDYVMRDLASINGGFFTAEDADSDGKEGLFYLWDKDEIKGILGDEDSTPFFDVFSLTGSIEDGLGSVMYVSNEMSDNLVQRKQYLEYKRMLTTLYDYRIKHRVRPHRDEKVLSDINGLMVKALINAGVVFQREDFLKHAIKCIEFIIRTGYSHTDGLYHRYIDNEWGICGLLNDYSNVISALLKLNEIDGKGWYLDSALELANLTISNFYDYENGGFFYSSSRCEDIPMRIKDISDDVMPSGNSVMMQNLLEISRIKGDIHYKEIALGIPRSDVSTLIGSPVSCCYLLNVALKYL